MSHLPKLTELRNSKKEIERPNAFEFRENLLRLTNPKHAHNQRSLFDSERGNPNWTALSARKAYLALEEFALQECGIDRNYESGFGGVPQKHGIAARFYKYLNNNKDQSGIALLTEIYKHCVRNYCTDLEEFVFEFAEGVAGNRNPYPVRMLRHCEKIVRAFLIQELCGENTPLIGNYDLFAVEGGTAGACQIINSLITNKLLRQGDRIALAVPVLTPYFETPQLEKFGLDITYIHASATDQNGNPNHQYPDCELDKLADPSIKAFFVMDPSNPASVVMEARSREYLTGIVRRHNPNLIIVTENTYGSFATGFRSLMADLPRNTITIYSFSKYFGCTGWCIGVVALHDDNIMDEMIASLPVADKEQLNRLYTNVTDRPENLKFIDRMAADSREVTLNCTAGLSAPQQIQMAVMGLFSLVDNLKGGTYRGDCLTLLQKRRDLFWESLGVAPPLDPNRIDYYCTFDIERWAVGAYGTDFSEWLKMNFSLKDIVYRIAEEYAVTFLNCDNYGLPEWSVRLSLASLDTNEYKILGTTLKNVLQDYVEAWKSDSPPSESLT